jgi:hypothetical protein
VVTVLIVIGVIAFLAFDAWLIAKVMGGHKSADDYGAFHVPGEITVTVPAGKLRINYQESYRADSDEDSIYFGTPAALEVHVTSATGEELPLQGPGFRGMGSSLSTGSNWSRALVGTVDVPTGTYIVTAGPELSDAVEPQILVGK